MKRGLSTTRKVVIALFAAVFVAVFAYALSLLGSATRAQTASAEETNSEDTTEIEYTEISSFDSYITDTTLTAGNYKLTSAITLSSAVTISEGSTVNLDLNGYTLTISGYTDSSNGALVNAGTLNVTSSQSGGILSVYGNTTYTNSGVINSGELTIGENVTLTSYFWTVYNTGALSVYGTINSYYSNTSYSMAVINISSSAKTTVYDGASLTGYFGIYNLNGELNFNGGSVSGTYIGVMTESNDNTINISGGTVYGGTWGVYTQAGTLNVTGGTITSDKYGIQANSSSVKTTITGGTIYGTYYGIVAYEAEITIGEEDGDDDALTIYGGDFAIDVYAKSANSTIYLYSGTIGSADTPEGIGLYGYGTSAYASLYMYGGTITAVSIGVFGNGSTGQGYDKIYMYGGSISAAYGMYLPQQQGETYIYGGTITGSSTGIEIRNGLLVIEGGTITSTAESFSVISNGSGTTVIGAAVAISSYSLQDISLTINGGTFSGLYAIYECYVNGSYDSDGNELTTKSTATTSTSAAVNGGTFSGTIYSSTVVSDNEGDVTYSLVISGGTYTTDVSAYAADGLTAEYDSESGTYGITLENDTSYVAYYNGTGYQTLAAALEAAAEAGSAYIIIYDDIAVTETLTVSGNITLYLNGYTISASCCNAITVASGAVLTITGGGAADTDSGYYAISNGGTLIIADGTFGAVYSTGALSITGGVINGEITISGGTFTISGGYFKTLLTEADFYADGLIPAVTEIDGVTYYTVMEGSFVTAPTQGATEYAYTGNEISFEFTDAAEGYTASGGSGTNAGEYTVTLTLSEGYVWSDFTFEDKTYTFTITSKSVTVSTESTAEGSVSTDNGFVEDVTVTLNEVTDESEYTVTADTIEEEVLAVAEDATKATVEAVYDVSLTTTGGSGITVSAATNGGSINITITLSSELISKTFYIMHIHDDGTIEQITDYTISGNDVTFTVDSLSQFAFVTVSDSRILTSLEVGVISAVIIFVIIILTAALTCGADKCVKKRRNRY